MKLLFDDGDQHVGGHGAPDLRLHRVLAGAQKALDAQMLLDPFEEQFHLPATLVQRGNPIKSWIVFSLPRISSRFSACALNDLNCLTRLTVAGFFKLSGSVAYELPAFSAARVRGHAHVLRYGDHVAQRVRAKQKRWDEGVGHQEREAFLKLPVAQRKVILAFV